MKLSVALVCFNEEADLRRTLEALAGLADEIVAVDSFSTDNTVALAREMGATVFQEPWAGHVGQKNSALAKCTGDWILAVDADEVLTEELVASIKSVLEEERDLNGYSINRRTFYMNRLLRYAWQPDRKLRLVRRAANPVWRGYDPHDSLWVKGKTARLDGYMIHYSYKNFAEHMQKTAAYARKAAESYHQAGKKASRLSLLLRPAFVLFKRLFINRAILDGFPGIMASWSSALYVYMKYAFLWELQNNSTSCTNAQPRS
jgi:glycosyltransferase involved in cell wall biosynthesis